MPYIIPLPDSDSNNEIRLPLDLLREVAMEIFNEAGQALVVHDSTWNSIQTWIDESAPTYATNDLGYGLFDPHVPDHLTGVLQSHAQRLRASYEWQMNLAQSILDAVDAIETTEQDIADSFPDNGPSDQPPSSPGLVP